MEDLVDIVVTALLISLIFGVSFQNAFWGIIVFIIVLVAGIFIWPFLMLGYYKILDLFSPIEPKTAKSTAQKPQKPEIQEAVVVKKLTPEEKARRKDSTQNLIIGILVVIIVVSLFFMGFSLLLYGDLSFGRNIGRY